MDKEKIIPSFEFVVGFIPHFKRLYWIVSSLKKKKRR